MYNNLIKAIIICFLLPVCAIADRFTLSLENDLFYGTDRAYTHGTKFCWSKDNVPSYLDSFFINREKKFIYTIAQYMYTPTNISSEILIENDRPYGGWLYFGYTFSAYTPTRLDSFEIDLGVTGEAALTDDTQQFIHKIVDSRKPMGWKHQLKEEVGLNLIWQHKDKHVLLKGFEVISHYGCSLGTIHTFANVGFMIRTGFNLPDDFGVSVMEPVNRDLRNWHCYLFTDVDGRYVARNFFLDGNLFEDSHHVPKEPLVADFRYGLCLGFKSFEVIYAHNIRTKEHKWQEEHNEFGSLILSWKY